MKKLILVTSPPACGKTFISRKLAKALPNCVYLDKDTLIVLSKQIFKVAGEEYNRSSDFFQREIRDYEYYAVLDFAFEALEYNDTVLINAPFTEEIRDNEYLDNLRAKLKEKDAELFVVWVHTDVEVCHEREDTINFTPSTSDRLPNISIRSSRPNAIRKHRAIHV